MTMRKMEIRVPVTRPLEVVDGEAALIDVRERDEREGDAGFIPGSRSFPAARLRADPSALLEAYPEGMHFVLVCLSGRRSAELASTLIERGVERVANLEGGILGWRAAGLPLCGIEAPAQELIPQVESIESLPRRIVSCFVAEATEAALSGLGPLNDDPRSIVEALLQSAKDDDGLRPDAVLEALERLGEIARFRRHPLPNIARNLDAMRAAVRPFMAEPLERG